MGNYICHRPSRRPLRRVAVSQRWAPSLEDETARRQAIALERQRQAQLEAERSARMSARREQRARDAWRAEARRNLEAKAQLLFPWDLLTSDRKIAAILTGQPPGSLFPIVQMAQLFAGVNVGVSLKKLGVSEPVMNFMTLSAPRTRSMTELTRAADFFVAAQAFEGRALDRATLIDNARNVLADLEDRLATLPDWLTLHELRGSWFTIRPTRGTAKAMWKKVADFTDPDMAHMLSADAP